MIFVERKCWILTFKVGYTLLQDTLYFSHTVNDFFRKAIFSLSTISHSPPFYDVPSFFGTAPHFEQFFASLPLCPFLVKSYPLLTKGCGLCKGTQPMHQIISYLYNI